MNTLSIKREVWDFYKHFLSKTNKKMKTRKTTTLKIHQHRLVKNQLAGECKQLGVFSERVMLKGNFTLTPKPAN